MKTKILQEKLQKVLTQLEKITGKDATLPILTNILLRADKNLLTATATNLETGILWQILAKTDEPGEVVLPAQTFSSLIASLPGGSVSIETKGTIITVTNDRRKSNINGFSAEEFPTLPIDVSGEVLIIRADILCQALSQVVNFASSSSIKPEITGVYVEFLKDKIKVVATDSFRLGEKTVTTHKKQELTINHKMIIPLRAVREMISIFGDKQGDLEVYFLNNQITVNMASQDDADVSQIKYISRLIEGEYPDYQVIIPTSFAASVSFSKKEILNHLKSASLFSGKNNEINIKISINDSLMVINSQSSDLGGYESEMKLEEVSGKDISITFNYRFLADGLNSIKSDKCVFEFSSDDGPGILKPADDKSFIYILMPIKKY